LNLPLLSSSSLYSQLQTRALFVVVVVIIVVVDIATLTGALSVFLPPCFKFLLLLGGSSSIVAWAHLRRWAPDGAIFYPYRPRAFNAVKVYAANLAAVLLRGPVVLVARKTSEPQAHVVDASCGESVSTVDVWSLPVSALSLPSHARNPRSPTIFSNTFAPPPIALAVAAAPIVATATILLHVPRLLPARPPAHPALLLSLHLLRVFPPHRAA
jgi:hypothetical protein